MPQLAEIINFIFRNALGIFEGPILFGELLLCTQQEFRRWGKPWLFFCAVAYITPPRLIEDFHLRSEFYLGTNWFSFGFLIMFLISLLILWTSFRIDWSLTLLFGITSYTLQHLCYSVASIMQFSMGWEIESIQLNAVRFWGTLFSLWFAYAVLGKYYNRNSEVRLQNNNLIVFSFFAIIIINVIHLWSYANGYQALDSFVYSGVCCILLLVALYGNFEGHRLERDKRLIEQLLHESELKHRYAMENAEVIDRKCHDLKHQIAALRSMEREQQEQYISELEQAVMIYERIFKTGCDTLDILLSEKRLLCEQADIQLTVVADAVALDFMDTVDLYALFGNALDNAVEAAAQVENSSARQIVLNIAQRGNILSVCLQNTCAHAADFVDGLPRTIKPDKENHGFGTKSIRYLVEKYGGTMELSQNGDIFTFNALFVTAVQGWAA